MVSTSASLVEKLRHDHDHGISERAHEARTRWVVALTIAMMVFELAVGYVTNSLALTADGWHMATHAGALGMAALAYWFARTRSRESAFSFGTGKVHALAGYTNAIALAVVALWMMYEAASRLVHPLPIAFGEALPVAIVGLLVNLASMKLLHVGHAHPHHEDGHHHDHHHEDGHHHDHHHEDGHHHDHHHHHDADDHHDHGDHNLRAAYLHVLADAFTSVLAILALVGGRYLGWYFLDPLMGIVGGVVISRWSYALCRGAARQLLDVVPSEELAARIRRHLQDVPGTEVVDLHVWEIGPKARACLASVVASEPRTPLDYAEKLRLAEGLAHVTIEVHRCGG
ncbi:CDF family Co(II)/Ni(II) efflux transporter DmeF [Pendulispora albinea]|uniref:CDF family Co(II)/Ni(II) efflux transporter DmeF n=1 Tax=Pendulispora albinea TaxID=2741071 RepID=A0ABZ2LZX6_9BACT